MFARGVDRRARATFVTERRGDVDDAAAALRLHHAQLVLHAQNRAEDVGVEGRGIALGGLVGGGSGLAFGAGGVDRDVEAAKADDRLVDEVADIVVMTNVGADKLGLRAGCAQLGDQFGTGIVVAPRDYETRTPLGISEGGGAGDQLVDAVDDEWMILFKRA